MPTKEDIMKYRLHLVCKETAQPRMGIAENVVTSFNCPMCGAALVFIPVEQRIGAHGRTAATVRHDLRKIEQISNEG